MGVGTEDIEAADSLAISQPQIVANFQDLGYSGSGGYKATAAITATAAGTTTLTVSSLRTQIFTGTTTQTVVMPVTSTLAVGYQYLIINNSTGVVTINSSGGNLIVALGAGTRILLTCILITGTTAASWNILNNLQVPGNAVIAGGLTAGALAGTGTRVVTASSTGELGVNTTGTWEVSLTCGTSGTITLNSSYKTGQYSILGNRVFINTLLIVDSVSSPLGVLNLSLPLKAKNNGNTYSCINLRLSNLETNAVSYFQSLVEIDSFNVRIEGFTNGQVEDISQYIKADSQMVFSGFYMI